MRRFRADSVIALSILPLVSICIAQEAPTTAIPNLIRYSGTLKDALGAVLSSTTAGVTFAIYKQQDGGAPVWEEAQNVTPDANGQYAVVLGGATAPGLPEDLFSQQEQRWLSVQIQGQAEQARVLLVSVPYAIKAHDSETLGGLPASAYMRAPAIDASSRVGTDTAAASVTAATTSGGTPVKPKTTPANNGQPNYIGKFTNTTDLVDSAMYEVNGNVGIFTTAPAISLDVRTGALPQMGIAGTSDYLTFFASDKFGPAIYWDPAKDMRFGKGGSGLYNPFGFVEQMRIQSSTGNVGIGTQTPGSTLDVNGNINFSGNVLYQGSPVLQVPAGPYQQNIALGLGALQSNTSGGGNTASGAAALQNNTSGFANTASGATALFDNTTGYGNTGSGQGALHYNTTGNDNTAIGYAALAGNTTGVLNTAIGSIAMEGNTTGSNNTAIGIQALDQNRTGNNNIAIGSLAANNVDIGTSNNIHIGSPGSQTDNATIRIGVPGLQTSFFVAGVSGVTTGMNNAVSVLIDSNGQLGTVSSSRRFKEDIQDMGDASHDLMRLRPVTFRYRKPFDDGTKPIQYGLIAEEVAGVYPDLVVHSADGQIETVKYQVLDSMLLNEVQRQEAEAQRQAAEILAQKDQIRRLTEQIHEQGQENRSLQERLAKLESALPSMARNSRVPSIQ